MPRKCPPGVICFENMSFIFLIVLAVLAIGLTIIYIQWRERMIIQTNIAVPPRQLPPRPPRDSREYRDPRDPRVPRFMKSVLLNPYTPPLRNTTFFSSSEGIPINIRTNSYDTSYRQVGLLTRINGGETILALMGRPLHTNRNKWQYYTMSDQNNSVKLPISRAGRSCTNEYGCDCLYNSDTVYVEGYNDAFKVTMYDNDIMRYIPFI